MKQFQLLIKSGIILKKRLIKIGGQKIPYFFYDISNSLIAAVDKNPPIYSKYKNQILKCFNNSYTMLDFSFRKIFTSGKSKSLVTVLSIFRKGINYLFETIQENYLSVKNK